MDGTTVYDAYVIIARANLSTDAKLTDEELNLILEAAGVGMGHIRKMIIKDARK